MDPTTPPLVSGGIPVLGHALEMMRSRESLFRREVHVVFGNGANHPSPVRVAYRRKRST